MKLSIVIPVRNETLTLKVVAHVIEALVDAEHEIVVVYDDPGDASVPVISDLGERHPNLVGVLNETASGAYGAVRAGVAAARGDYVLIYTADEIVPIIAIPYLLSLMDDGCDFVAMTRYRHGGGRFGRSRVGTWLSLLANRMFRRIAGATLSDCTSGAKMFRPRDFDDLLEDAQPQGWDFAFEMAVNAQLRGMTLGEVPIISVDRMFGGESTYRLWPWVVSYTRVLLRGLRRLGFHPFRRPAEPRVLFPPNVSQPSSRGPT